MGFTPIPRRLGLQAAKRNMQEEQRRKKLVALLNEVFLNYLAQKEWTDNVDPDFMACAETFIKRYDPQLAKEQWMRTGIMLGAIYEQWRQKAQ